MRKFTFVLIMMLGFVGFSMAQRTIDNFEIIKMNVMKADPPAVDLSSFTPIANPDTAGVTNINKSGMVCKFVRSMNGVAWGGFYAPIAPVDMTTNKYIHVKVWKPRITDVKVKLEAGSTGPSSPELLPMHKQTKINAWEELVFRYADSITGNYNQLVFEPDNISPVGLTADMTMYFDDFYVNNDSTVGSARLQVIEDFEHIPMHPYSEQGTFTLVPNPDPTGLNLSAWVMDFLRPMAGPDWAGFYSQLAANGYDSVDVTTNKYVHVKAWKPRISVVKFKLEGGTPGTFELESKYPQANINDWEDYVFDFSKHPGKYPIIGLSLDAGAAALTQDIHIYFDDIIVNNDSMQAMPPEQKISINMGGAGLVAGDSVFISGTFGGIYGTWVQPGTNLNNRMLEDPLNPGLYSIYMHLADGAYAFKFFIVHNNGWNGSDPIFTGNRSVNISGNANLIYTWGTGDVTVSARENPIAGKILMYPNPVRNELTVNSTFDVRRVTITSMVGKMVGNYTFNSAGTQTINTSGLSRGMYLITFIGKDGNKVTQKLIKD